MEATTIRRGRVRQAQRQRLVAPLGARQGGVLSRNQLRELKMDRNDVRNERLAGRWRALGRHTVAVGEVTDVGRRWTALFEVGGNAALDGATALVELGLTGFTPHTIDVSVPAQSRPAAPPLPGIVAHRPLERGPIIVSPSGLPVVAPHVATVRAAQNAVSDRQAALIVCLATQQKIVQPRLLSEFWSTVKRSSRRDFLDRLFVVVCDGVTALSELDFADQCMRRGYPTPSRQSVRVLPSGVALLDAHFDDYDFAVEVDGSHHLQAAQAMDDMLRQNDVVVLGTPVLRVPVLGLLLKCDEFMDQVGRMLVARGWTPPAGSSIGQIERSCALSVR